MRTVVIDGVTYHPETPVEAEVHALLNEVYGALWIEAYYDPTSKHSREYAASLAQKMCRLNELMGFKK